MKIVKFWSVLNGVLFFILLVMITLPQLPFLNTALAPIIDAKTIDIHYGKHHQAYVNKLNELIVGTPFEHMDLESIISSVEMGPLFNNAAQIWNHTFYRNSLRLAQIDNIPQNEILWAIEQKRSTFDAFKQEFITKATNNFGSGWTWLAKTPDNQLEIINTSNAGTPLRSETVIGNKDLLAYVPLFTIDVWEHAYYLDYQNRRPEYLTNIRSLINRSFVESNYTK